MSPKEVLRFWFEELSPDDHFKKNLRLDEEIRRRFLPTLEKAAKGDLFSWRTTPEGRLAEIIVLDQFSRNIHRDKPESFAQDPLALSLAESAVWDGDDDKLDVSQRSFLYMPYMHSESKSVHEKAVRLFSQSGLEANLKFELLHKAIIDRFGRFPHRNKVLGRASTPEEIDFLKTPNSSF